MFDRWFSYRRQISMISVAVNYIWTGIVFCVINRNIVRFVGLPIVIDDRFIHIYPCKTTLENYNSQFVSVQYISSTRT